MELRSTGNPDTSNSVTMSVLEYLSSKGCETMATRNILHVSKLQEFEDFLETKGYMIVATSKNPYEVLRAQKGGDTVIVYQKKDAKEHLSTMDKDYRLVREFIKSQRKQSNADRIRNMDDEELAEFLIDFNECNYCSAEGECTFETCEKNWKKVRFGMACSDRGGVNMSEKIVYTADDEEPNCGQCNHVTDSDKWCMEHCGGANSWDGYERTEYLGGEE